MKDANRIVNNEPISEESHADYVSVPLEDSPFMVVKGSEGWNLAIGRFRMYHEFEATKEDLLEKLDNERWGMIAKIAGVIAEMAIDQYMINANKAIEEQLKISKK